jgi:NAD(P)H-dependent FMN reductase
MTQRIAVVIGSTRPARITSVIAEWLLERLGEGGAASYEILDLAVVDLPFLDEPVKPALGGYLHEHTKRWSETVTGYDGFVFVFPQYNWGYPAPLKNALDFLYHEWAGKPAALVTHGTRGGARAAKQLHEVLLGLHMVPLEPYLLISIAGDAVDGAEQFLDAAATLAPYAGEGRALAVALGVALAS